MGDILDHEIAESATILELGTGPGYLAKYLLNRCLTFPTIQYHCLDYSSAMLKIAERNLADHCPRVSFHQADLSDSSWTKGLEGSYSAILSTWALHDLGSPAAVASVYEASTELLADNGLLLNADFIKPAGLDLDFEEGRFLISKHLDFLKGAGFSEVVCTKEFEINRNAPASHNNYACLKSRHIKAVVSTPLRAPRFTT